MTPTFDPSVSDPQGIALALIMFEIFLVGLYLLVQSVRLQAEKERIEEAERQRLATEPWREWL